MIIFLRQLINRATKISGYTIILVLACSLLIAGCSPGSSDSDKEVPDSSERFGSDPDGGGGGGGDGGGDGDGGDEPCTPTGPIEVTPPLINFGLNQVGQVECGTIRVTDCITFSAEISDSSSTDIIPGDDGDEEVQEFFLMTESGGEATARLEGLEGSVGVCYRRAAPGRDTGRVNVVVGGGSTVYAFVVTLSGRTVEQLFTINAPYEGQLVWEEDGISTYSRSNSTFTLPVSGTLNGALTSVFTDNQITVSVAGTTQTINHGNELNFSGTVEIPSNPDYYEISFSKETIDGTITVTKNVIRFYKPQVTLEVRDPASEDWDLVSVLDEEEEEECEEGDEECEEGPDPIVTDSEYLHAGILVSNLHVSGPRISHPVRMLLRLFRPDGTTETILNNEYFYTGFEFGETTGERGRCGPGFANPDQTYCAILPHAIDLGRGVNTLTATVCNEYTDDVEGEECITSTVTIILDNDLPTISCASPGENKIYALDEDVILKCTIRNYVPHIPNEEDEDTPLCPVKIWINTSTAIAPPSTGAFRFCPTVEEEDADPVESGNAGNIKRGEIEINLSEEHGNILTTYTNLIQLRTENVKGHVTIKVISFQRGNYASSSLYTTLIREGGYFRPRLDMKTSQLGRITSGDGSTRRSPIMINISEGTLNSPKVKAVVKKLLNDNLVFADLAMGGGLKEDDDGNIEPIGTGTDEISPMSEIINMLHGSSPEQVRALMDYQRIEGSTTAYFDADTAKDACGQPITTAIITPDVYQYLFPEWDPSWLWDDVVGLREWPMVCNEDPESERANCNTVEQGKWDININLKDNGFIDVTLSLEGITDEDGRKKPAFWGHFSAYNLIEQGTTGAYGGPPVPSWMPFIDETDGIADPVIPILMNLSRLEIKLTDMLRIYKVDKREDGSIEMCNDPVTGDHRPCPCHSSNCTNMLYIYGDRVHASNTAFKFEPYRGCKEYFEEKYPGYNLPYGCNPGRDRYFPFLIDTTSMQGYLLWDVVGERGNNTSLLTLMRSVFTHTFKNIISCIHTEMVNPIIDPDAFSFPPWVPEDSDLRDLTDLRFALDDTNDEISFKQLKDARNPVFTFEPNIKDADLIIKNGSLKAKIPVTLGASNVPAPSGITKIWDGHPTRTRGYMFRHPSRSDFEDDYPLEMSLSQMKENSPYLSASLGIEEVLHAATHLLWQKGPKVILDLADVDELDPPSNRELDDRTVGIDAVILGRLDLCGGISDGLLKVTLPPDILFQKVLSAFHSEATHWDIILDKNQPPTLLINPVEGDPDAAEIQLGLSNVHVDVMEFIQDPELVRERAAYTIGDSVFKLRLDALLKLTAKYRRESRRLEIYINPYEDMPFYISVIERGDTYNDADVIDELERNPGGILPQLFGKISRSYNPELGQYDPETEEGNRAGIAMDLPLHITEFSDMEAENNIDAGINIGCREEGEELEEGEEPEPWPPIYSVDRFDYKKKTPIPTKKNNGTIRAYIVDELCGTMGENELRDTLCEDFGIQEISFGSNYPNLIFDTDNGYLHLSSKLIIDVYDWLWREISTDEE